MAVQGEKDRLKTV